MYSRFPAPQYCRQPGSTGPGENNRHASWLFAYVCERTQLTISGPLIAPGWRATSRPFLKTTSVGIERMAYCEAMACSASVFNFARRIPGSSSAAACSKAGAIILHGPHHGAQKSTTTGISFLPMCLEKLSARNSSGWAANKSWLHFPQRGASLRRCAGIRLTAVQWGQTICRESLKPFHLHVGNVSNSQAA